MPEKMPKKQPALQPVIEISSDELKGLREDVKEEHRLATRYAVATTFSTVLGGAGVVLMMGNFLSSEAPGNTLLAGTVGMVGVVGMCTFPTRGEKHRRRAEKLDDAIFDALARSRVASSPLELPQEGVDPASFDLTDADTRNVVVTAARLDEILSSKGVSLDKLVDIAPVEPPATPEP